MFITERRKHEGVTVTFPSGETVTLVSLGCKPCHGSDAQSAVWGVIVADEADIMIVKDTRALREKGAA